MVRELTWSDQSVLHRFRARFSVLLFQCLWSRIAAFLCLITYVRFFFYPLLLMTFGHSVTDNCSRFCFLILLIYTLHWIRDISTPWRGGRRSKWFRSLSIWKWGAQYFQARLIVSEELREWSKSNNRNISENEESIQLPVSFNYLLGYHPHGAYATGANFAYASESLNVSKIFPGIKIYTTTFNSCFYVPFFREHILLNGTVSVRRESLVYLLDKNKTGVSGNLVVVAPGGGPESLEARPGQYVIVLNRKRGFFQLALQTGACLVPSIGFGETNLFDQVPNPEGSTLRRLQDRMMRIFPLALIYSTHVLPYRRPVTVVVGRPIMCDRISDPTEEDVNELRRQYKQELVQMFSKYRPLYDPTAEEIRFI
ncbi:hypothetical protein Aperf_G00000055758 [Anoplocephala perfoliata]